MFNALPWTLDFKRWTVDPINDPNRTPSNTNLIED